MLEFTVGKVYTLTSVFNRMCRIAFGDDHKEMWPEIIDSVNKVED